MPPVLTSSRLTFAYQCDLWHDNTSLFMSLGKPQPLAYVFIFYISSGGHLNIYLEDKIDSRNQTFFIVSRSYRREPQKFEHYSIIAIYFWAFTQTTIRTSI